MKSFAPNDRLSVFSFQPAAEMTTTVNIAPMVEGMLDMSCLPGFLAVERRNIVTMNRLICPAHQVVTPTIRAGVYSSVMILPEESSEPLDISGFARKQFLHTNAINVAEKSASCIHAYATEASTIS